MRPDFSTAACILFASASDTVSGLSQMTWTPASRKAIAGPACMWLGVTIATASIPSARAASAFAMLA